MESLEIFWSAFNILTNISLILLGGICAGGAISSIIGVITQIDDHAIRFSLRLGCLFLICYLSAPTLTKSITDFSHKMWEGKIQESSNIEAKPR